MLLPEYPSDAAYVLQRFEATAPAFETLPCPLDTRSSLPRQDKWFDYEDGNILWRYTSRQGSPRPRAPVSLDSGWVCIRTNTCQTMYGFRSYESFTINIVRFARPPAANYFATHPAKEVRDLRLDLR
jgi:hypothetical protein